MHFVTSFPVSLYSLPISDFFFFSFGTCGLIFFYSILAIRSLEKLNRRIDAFRQSPIWQSSPALRRECLLLTTPVASSAATPSSEEEKRNLLGNVGENKDKLQQVSNEANKRVDDSSTTTATPLGSSPSSSSSSNEQQEVHVETKTITFESGVQMIQDLLLDTQKQCVIMVSSGQVFFCVE